MFFDGSHKGAKPKSKRPARSKAAKGAKLGGGANSSDLVAKAREDREKRRQEKLQRNSARTVQAAVRSFLAREAARQTVRESWDEQAGTWAVDTQPPEGSPGTHDPLFARVVGAFLFFYTPRKDAARARMVCQLMSRLLRGNLLQRLVACPGPQLRQYELLCRRLMCALQPRAAAAASMTSPADLQASVQAAEVVLAMTDWDRWTKAGMEKGQACTVCWGMLAALVESGMLEETAGFLQNRRVHLPLLVSVVGLSLRPVFLGVPRTAEVDKCRIRFCTSVACVPKLVESVPSAMVSMFRRPRLWCALLPVLANVTSASGLPVVGTRIPALLGNLMDLAAPLLNDSDVEFVSSFFIVLSSALPYVFSQAVDSRATLFDDDSDVEEDDEAATDPGPAGGDAKRCRVGTDQHAIVAVQSQLEEALLKPATIGPALQACLAEEAGEEGMSAALHVCFAVEWILRASPSRLAPQGPRRGVLNFIAFQDGSKALLTKMWNCLMSGDAFQHMQEGLLGGALSSDLRLRRSTLILFCESYSHLLTTQDDEEFFVKQIPFSLEHIRGMITVLRDTASALYLSSDAEERYLAAPEDVAATRHLLGSMTHLLRRLFTRDSRRPFCEASHWVAPGARANNDAMVASVVDTHDARHGQWQRLCRLMPYAVPFESRVRIFHERVRRDRMERQGGPDDRGTSVRVRRDHLFEDALEQLGGLGDNIKSKLRVQFIDVHGLEEAGIDGGGLFKEFMHEIVRTAFGPDYALFKSTPEHLLYPNPSSDILGPEHLQHFHFLGLIVGKALYEGVLIDLPLAGFFLSKILGQFNFVDDLPSLDEELYRNLMFLKTYDGDCEDLHLNFAIVNSEYDETRVTELMPNGKDIAVTNENRIHYIHRVANYRLNFQIKRQSMAFLGGLREIIPTEWFQMFGESELQQVISGTRGGIDLDNLKHYTNYSGGYNPHHPVIDLFWHVVGTLSTEQQASLLRFATSSDRAPLLGFQYLNPPFCIHRGSPDLARLPTASTCMNLLKLPPYESEDVMREKIVNAIESAVGFDLS